jgi:predicted acetyltransferase
MTTYRSLSDDDDRFDRFVRYAFRPEEGPPSEDDFDDAGLGERRGMFNGEELRAVCRHHFFSARVRGVDVDLAGLSAVASPPESRRQGVVGEMLAESLTEYRDRGCELAALWPFKRSFYARYGWATANRYVTVDLPAEELAFADEGDERGTFRRVDPDDWAPLDAVYDDHAARYTLALDRTEEWWRERVFSGWGTDPYVYAVDCDGEGEDEGTVGYVRYTIEDGEGEGEGDRLVVTDAAWTDRDAFGDLLRFCYYHDSQVDVVRLRGATDGGMWDLQDLVSDDREVTVTVSRGPMVRVVDVEDALERFSYAAGVDEHLRVAVSDPVADWNDGVFDLDVTDGTATCRHVGRAADMDIDVDVALSVNALSQAVVGYRPVDRLANIGEVTADVDSLARLDTVFPATDVYLREFF